MRIDQLRCDGHGNPPSKELETADARTARNQEMPTEKQHQLADGGRKEMDGLQRAPFRAYLTYLAIPSMGNYASDN